MSFDATLDHDRDALLRRIAEMEVQIGVLGQELMLANRLATMGVLAGMVAHEFSNLLTPVLNYAQLALHNPDDRELVVKALTRVVDGTDQVNRIAASILGFVQHDEQLATTDVSRVIDEAISCMAQRPQKRGIRFNKNVPDGLRVAIRPICLQQVFVNLFINAMEAMEPRGGDLIVSARVANRGRVIIEVRDSGPGIQPDMVSRIFEPLVSFGNPGTKPDDQKRGHGLGLAVCRRLIEDASGSITVDSRIGLGTVFRIELPQAKRDGRKSSA